MTLSTACLVLVKSRLIRAIEFVKCVEPLFMHRALKCVDVQGNRQIRLDAFSAVGSADWIVAQRLTQFLTSLPGSLVLVVVLNANQMSNKIVCIFFYCSDGCIVIKPKKNRFICRWYLGSEADDI